MLKAFTDARFWPACWVVLALLVLIADYSTGPFIHLPILFLVPVTFATWRSGRRWGMAMACVLPLVRMVFAAFWSIPWGALEVIVNGLIQMVVLSVFAFLTDQAVQRKMLAAEVQMLRGILPICSFCKRIRNSDDVWEPLEKYISERSDARFSHSLCPECAARHYGKIVESLGKQRENQP